MPIDNELYPVMEAYAYEKLKNNFTYKKQTKLYLPRSTNNIVYLVTPSLEDSINTINDNDFITFYRSGYRVYTTATRFASRIGSTTIHTNKRTQYRKEFMDTRTNKTMRWMTPDEVKKSIASRGKNIVYDLGAWHSLYFANRYIRNQQFMCKNYIDFLVSKINEFPGSGFSYNKCLLIPVNTWFSTNNELGIKKENLNNPLSIIMLALYRYPMEIAKLARLNVSILLVDEVRHDYIRLNLLPDIGNLKNSKAVYTRLKVQLRKMTIFKVLDDEDNVNVDAEKEKDAMNASLRKEFSRNLTGTKNTKDVNIFNIDKSEEHDSIADDMSEDDNTPDKNDVLSDMKVEETEDDTPNAIEEEPIETIDDEIKNEVDRAITTDDSLKDPTMTKDEKAAKIEDRVKRNVMITKFVPTYSAAKTAKIEEYAKRHEEVLKQSVPDMKSKIIETSSYENVLDVHNPNITKSKFANFEKSYVDKKLKPDLVNSVGKLSQADYPIFIESVDIKDSSDAFNQIDTYTFNMVDEDGRKQTIVLDVPKIIDNNYIFLSGNKKMIIKQRLNRPIVKIAPDTVQICTWYNKCMITRYGQVIDSKAAALKKYISKNEVKYKVVFGNAKVLNKDYRTSLDFDIFAKSMIEAKIGGVRFIFDLNKLEKEMQAAGIKEPMVVGDSLACGIQGDKVIRFTVDGRNSDEGSGLTEVIIAHLPKDEREALASTPAGKKFAYAGMTVMASKIPVAYFMLFCEGWTKMMEDCKIPYTVTEKTHEAKKTNLTEDVGMIECQDKYIFYNKYPYENSLLMNGLQGLPFSSYTYEELDSKDTYIDMLTLFYTSANMADNLDQFKNFLLDDASIEMLKDFNQPTELVPLLYYACQLLVNNQYVADTDVSSMRIRSTEIIPQIAYEVIVNAYGAYKKHAARGKKKVKINVNRGDVIKALMSSNMIEDYSVTNPVMTLEKTHTCTVKAHTDIRGITLNGQNKSNGMTMARRAYDDTMVGVFGITSSADGEVGVKRMLTVEPNITSTRGYIEATPKENLDNLNSANLFTFAESLTPPGIRHDDPQRSAMMRGQTSQMVMTSDPSPVLIGNHVESVVPYHMSGEFCFVAKQDGTIVDNKDGVYVVKYKDGTFESFETNPIIHKNSSEGNYTEIKFNCDHEVGYKFVQNEVLAADPRAFTMNDNGKTASMNIGVLAKVAIVSTYDIYEDSEPISKKLSERLAYDVINMKPVSLSAGTYIDRIVKIGDHVNMGDPLIVFDANSGDPEVEEFLASIKNRSDVAASIVETTQTTVKSDESGVVEDIRIYSTVPLEMLSPTLQKLTKTYRTRIDSKSKFLDKYRNPTDNDFYKCGRIVSETTEEVDTKFGVIKGTRVGEGVYIEFYIKHTDIIKKGDKNTNYCALKGVTSHVMDEGMEPFSEFRKDEEISALIAPLSILARKTPSIYTNLFGNKVLIEAKRKLKEDYMKD